MLREKTREFKQQHEIAQKAHDDVESTMNVSINNLQLELGAVKAKQEKVIGLTSLIANHIHITQLFLRRICV